MSPSARIGISQKALEEQDESLWAEVKPTDNVGIPIDVPKREMARSKKSGERSFQEDDLDEEI